MKISLPIVMVLGSLMLAGAGCQPSQTPTTTPPVVTSTPPTSTGGQPTTTTPPTTTDFTLTATSSGSGTVKLSWTAPSDLPATATIRLLHSAKPDVKYPDRSFWQGVTKDKTSFEWNGVPAGKRYFRACVFVAGACTTYSNEVELDVK